ncbi:hypothetical protein [Natronobeatus ordinarius]|uniref:hypothetical protein n=1 Tax=Natronobeatus ordinarius TaxID=2963433 RepID=UPI0020CE2362|nr:hypothetical protein [Natronobeatus ordinarius]
MHRRPPTPAPPARHPELDSSVVEDDADFTSWRQDGFSSDIYGLTCTPHTELLSTASGNWSVEDSSLGGC